MTPAEVARARWRYVDAVRPPRPTPARAAAAALAEVEVSGGMTLETVRPMRRDRASTSSRSAALTHSAPALDLSLEIVRLG